MKQKYPKIKIYVLGGIVLLYIILGIVFRTTMLDKVIPNSLGSVEANVAADMIVQNSTLNTSSDVQSHLDAAVSFFKNDFVKSSGHIDLYIPMIERSNPDTQPNVDANTNVANPSNISSNLSLPEGLYDNRTNSEAISYYLLWAANANDSQDFNTELQFLKSKMMQPNFGYIMWRLESNDTVKGDGSNDASDADLRVIKALMIAQDNWPYATYSDVIDNISSGLEKVAVTDDKYLAPYGGASGQTSTWKANEVYLSYTDFTVLKELSLRYGDPWRSVYANMKAATLKAQIANGLYNSQLTIDRVYGNGIDGGGYGINSLWMMVRNAESNDPELMASANKSLQFYKSKFIVDGELYGMYGSNGDALSPTDTPWAYALAGRAAIELNDPDFAKQMIAKLLEHQVNDNASLYYGAFPEDYKSSKRIGQFTMQESILTMQDYLKKYGNN